ncbi:MAG TPA: hypothetical protein VMT26_02715 [Candidatus Bathyarchaeia archaeon]|nr:hypothetical protein [Candidatus Bathyarchaeia archaeon]
MSKNRRAISTAISTVILTGAVIVLLLIAIVFANNFLDARLAENEFSAMKQFMQTTGLQMDDVSWTIGRTQTIRYASRYANVNFESVALNYSVYVDKGSGYVFLANFSTGIIMFNMPINQYTISNNYYEGIAPSSDNSFLQEGTSAPVCHVYVMEKIPMNDGNYIRVVAAPSIRMLNSTISTASENQNYFKFYLPILSSGTNPRYSQSITLVGKTVSVLTQSGVNRIKIDVVAPKTSLGFDLDFFHFKNVEEVVDVPDGSTIQFYTGYVEVSLGLYI